MQNNSQKLFSPSFEVCKACNTIANTYNNETWKLVVKTIFDDFYNRDQYWYYSQICLNDHLFKLTICP